MTIKQDVIEKAKEKTKPNDTVGFRMNKDEKKEMQKQAKGMGLKLTEFILGCCRYLKGKL